MLSISELYYTYPGASKASLRGLNLTVAEGALFGLLGPNGAGKTTLLSIITSELAADAGRIRFSDSVQTGAISLVPQDFAFYDKLTVKENLQLFAGLVTTSKTSAQQRMAHCLATCHLSQHQHTAANQLSGGLKRRLNLAIGLLSEPKLLLLDEPTVGIDPQSRHFILESIAAINAQGITVIYTSHYMEEIETLCDHIAIIDNGKTLLQGNTNELKARHEKTLTITVAQPPSAEQFNSLSSKYALNCDGCALHFNSDGVQHELAQIFADLQSLHLEVCSASYGELGLENLFMQLTSTELRD